MNQKVDKINLILQSSGSVYTIATQSGGNILNLQSDGAVTFNDSYTFPTSDGQNEYALKTDGSGQLAWQPVITGITAGNGLSGGGTQGQFTLSVNLGENSGLTFSGDNIIVDTNIAGNGLDFANGILTVNTSEITSTLAGNGLTANSGALDINVNIDSLEIVNDEVRLKNTITGDRTFQDSVTVGGNFTVNGTVSYIYTENVYISDNILTLNATWSSGSPILDAGFEVLRGASQASILKWDESQDLWVVGLSGSIPSAIITENGIGLTKSGNTLSIDTVGFAATLAGNGLTSSGGTLNINTTNGLTIINDDVQISNTVAGSGLTFGSGVIDVQLSPLKGLTFSTTGADGTLEVSLKQNGGLTFSNGQIQAVVDGTTIFIVDGVIKGAAQGVLGITAGAGLSGGGTSSYVNLDVNTGLGLTISNDSVSMIWGGTSTGLTFSNNSISAAVDGVTIQIVNGLLTGAAQGVLGITAGAGLSGGGSSSYVTLSVNAQNGLSIVNDYVQLGGTLSQTTYINGQFNDFFATNFDYIQFTSSTFDVESEFISLEAGTGSVQIIAGDQINISSVDGSFVASGLLDLQSNGLLTIDSGIGMVQINADDDIVLNSSQGDISLTTIYNLLISATSGSITTNDGRGLVYSQDYTNTFVTHSLITKGYVDSATASLWNAINSLNSIPVYEKKLSLSTSGNNQPTGLTLSFIPNDYSRIEVFVNGQIQILGDGVSAGFDCYFSDGITTKNLSSLVIGDQLYWNGVVAGFNLTTSDTIYIIYEK